MRFWFSGPKFGPFHSGASLSAGSHRPFSRPRSPAHGQFVYVIEGDHGAVKVGISSDPASRRATLQTGAPHRLFLAFSIWAGESAFDIEQEAHAILNAHRMPGEWFFVSKEMAVAAIYAAAARLGAPLGEPPASEPRQINVTLWAIVLLFAAGFAMKFWEALANAGK